MTSTPLCPAAWSSSAEMLLTPGDRDLG